MQLSSSFGDMRSLARNVVAKANKAGKDVFYWEPHWRDRRKGCPVRCATLGADIVEANLAATILNARVDSWRNSRAILCDVSSLLNVNSVELSHAEKEVCDA